MTWTRFRKVGADLAVRWGRSLLTLAGLSLGLFGVGMVLVALTILSGDLNANYRQTNPANIVMQVQGLTDVAQARAAATSGVGDVERRGAFGARVETMPGRWMPIRMAVVDDFERLNVARFYSRGRGTWPPPTGEMLIERDGVFFFREPIGAPMRLRLSDGRVVQSALSGYAFDPGQAPSRMDRILYGYVSRSTALAWGGPVADQLLIKARTPTDAARVAAAVEANLTAAGARVLRTEIHASPEHPHQFQLNSIVALLGGLAVACLMLCAALTTNLIDALMTAERRSIGVMRAIGGGSATIAGDYVLATGMMGLAASLLTLRPAIDVGRSVATFVARSLNFELISEAGPLWLATVVVAFGVAVPVIVATLRVSQAVSGPVRDALSRVEAGQGTPLAEGLGVLASPLPLVARMAVRSCVRRPRRVLLTGLSLALGLAFFMTALNVRTSLMGTVGSVAHARNHDLAVTFAQPYLTADLQTWIMQQPGVRRAEFWIQGEGVLRRGGLQVANPTAVLAAPDQTWAMRPNVLAGRWLDPRQPDGIVVTQKVLSDEPVVRLGGAYQLAIGGRSVPVRVIGVIKEFGAGGVYVPRTLFDGLVSADGRSNLMFVDAGAPGFFQQSALASNLEAAAAQQGWGIATVLPSRMMDVIVANHLDVLTILLLIIAVVVLCIGAVGVASSISVSVVERYREIGVLKAIGGRSGAIVGLFVSEAVVIAVVGWGISLIPAPLFGRSVAETFGSVFIEYPFDYRAAWYGAPLALGLAVLLALIASLPPLIAALRTTVRTALRTE